MNNPSNQVHWLALASIRRWVGFEDSILIRIVDSGFGCGFVTRLVVAVVSTLLSGLRLLRLGGQGVTASGGPQMRV